MFGPGGLPSPSFTTGGDPCLRPALSTTSASAFRISPRPRSTTTSSCPSLGSKSGSRPAPADHSTTGLDGDRGAQLFFYQAEEPGTYSRHHTGLHHIAFLVASRAVVREAHQWARARDAVVLDEPGEFPQYGPDCFATYWLDPHWHQARGGLPQSRRELGESESGCAIDRAG